MKITKMLLPVVLCSLALGACSSNADGVLDSGPLHSAELFIQRVCHASILQPKNQQRP